MVWEGHSCWRGGEDNNYGWFWSFVVWSWQSLCLTWSNKPLEPKTNDFPQNIYPSHSFAIQQKQTAYIPVFEWVSYPCCIQHINNWSLVEYPLRVIQQKTTHTHKSIDLRLGGVPKQTTSLSKGCGKILKIPQNTPWSNHHQIWTWKFPELTFQICKYLNQRFVRIVVGIICSSTNHHVVQLVIQRESAKEKNMYSPEN